MNQWFVVPASAGPASHHRLKAGLQTSGGGGEDAPEVRRRILGLKSQEIGRPLQMLWTRPVESPRRSTPWAPMRSARLRKQVAHGHAAVLDEAARRQRAAAAAGQDDRQVACACGGCRRRCRCRRRSSNCAGATCRRRPSSAPASPGTWRTASCTRQIDLRDLLDHVLLVLVMRQVVVAFGDADLREGAVAAVVGQQERGDARRVGLERQRASCRT